MKGILQQIRENEVIYSDRLTQKDIEDLACKIEESIKQACKRKKEWLKEREVNRKALNKRAEELKQEIPLEVAWHCFLAPYQTYVNTEFLEIYKEWL